MGRSEVDTLVDEGEKASRGLDVEAITVKRGSESIVGKMAGM